MTIPRIISCFDQQFEAIAEAVADGVEKAVREEEKRELPVYYMVQTGAYRLRSLAEQQLAELQSQGYPAFLVYDNGYYDVRAGAFFESGLCGGPGRRAPIPRL